MKPSALLAVLAVACAALVLAAAPPAEASVRAEVEALIQEHPVLLFTKSYCGYCKRSLLLLDRMGQLSHNVVLDEMGARGRDYQQALREITGQRTVPNIFIHGKHLGGNSDLEAASRDGRLQAMLDDAL